jgi:plasmid stability protein
MTTTLELPDDLIGEIKARAAQDGKELNDEIAELLRKGLAVPPGERGDSLVADETLLKRRREVAEKFLSGEWGAELAGFEAGRAAERESSRKRAKLWRD